MSLMMILFFYSLLRFYRKGEKMRTNSILNTNQYTKIVIKREDDDTVVAVITEDDVDPAPNYIAVLTPNYN